jgi:hypothetical protein
MKFAKNYPDMELYFDDGHVLFLNKGALNGNEMWRDYHCHPHTKIPLEMLEELFDDWEFEDMKEPDYSYPAFNPEKLKKCKISFERSDLQCLGDYQGVTMNFVSKRGIEHKQFIETMTMGNMHNYFRRCVFLYDFD